MEQIAPVGHTCHPADNVRIDLCRDTGTGIQNGQRVSHGTIGKAGDELRPLAGQLQSLLPGDVLHTLGDVLGADAGKIVPLAPGKDGGGDLLDLRGRQNKDDVGRRLLQRFQQGVKGVGGKRVRLVDYVYLVLQLKRHEPRLFDYVAHIVHAGVAGSVQLDYIRALPGAYFAGAAAAAGLAIYGRIAVHRPCEYARGAGLAGTTGAREKVGMGGRA